MLFNAAETNDDAILTPLPFSEGSFGTSSSTYRCIYSIQLTITKYLITDSECWSYIRDVDYLRSVQVTSDHQTILRERRSVS